MRHSADIPYLHTHTHTHTEFSIISSTNALLDILFRVVLLASPSLSFGSIDGEQKVTVRSAQSIGTVGSIRSVYSAALAASVAWASNGLEKKMVSAAVELSGRNADLFALALCRRFLCDRRLQCGDRKREIGKTEKPVHRPLYRLAYSIDRNLELEAFLASFWPDALCLAAASR